MEYRCIRKCHHKDRIFEKGEILEVGPGEAVPRHFEPTKGTKKALEVPADVPADTGSEDKGAILEALKAEADALGIEAKGNWGINAYTKAVNKAKAEADASD